MARRSSPIPTSAVDDARATRAPWLPLIVIVLAQLQMNMNISALPVSLGPIAEDLRAPATAAATALLIYSLFVAAFVMLGAKIGSLAGERLVLQVCVVVHGVAMALMSLSTSALSWRYSSWLIVLVAVAVFILSFRLAPVARQRDVRIDIIGVVLSATAIALILLGVRTLQPWGSLIAKDAAPFSLLRLSPAPMLIVVGLVVGQAFFAWSHRRVAADRRPLLAMEVLDSREEKNAVVAFLVTEEVGRRRGRTARRGEQRLECVGRGVHQRRGALAARCLSRLGVRPLRAAASAPRRSPFRRRRLQEQRRVAQCARCSLGDTGAGGRSGRDQ